MGLSVFHQASPLDKQRRAVPQSGMILLKLLVKTNYPGYLTLVV